MYLRPSVFFRFAKLLNSAVVVLFASSFFATISDAFEGGQSSAQPNHSLPPKVVSAMLFADGGSAPSSSFDLGVVEPGKLNEFTVVLRNETGEVFEFASLDAGCNCRSFDPTKGRIGVQKDLQFAFGIEIPVHPRGGGELGHGAVTFVASDGTINGELTFTYRYSNYIGFKTDFQIVEYHKSDSSISVLAPLTIGDAVDVSDYHLAIPGLDLPKIKIPTSGSFQIDPASLSSSRERHSLELSREDSDASPVVDRLNVVFIERNAVEVAPSIIRLSIDEHSNRLSGSTFVSLHSEAETAVVSATLQFEEKTIPLKWSRQSSHLGKLSLDIPVFNADRMGNRTVVAVLHGIAGDQKLDQKLWLVFPSFSSKEEVKP